VIEGPVPIPRSLERGCGLNLGSHGIQVLSKRYYLQEGVILMSGLAIDLEGLDMELDLDTLLGRAVLAGMYGLNWRPTAPHKVTVTCLGKSYLLSKQKGKHILP
jgi:hypothetical protein